MPCVGAPQNTHYFVWLRCGSKVQMFQLHNGSRLDVSGSSASVAATWNWIPTPSYVVLGDNYSTLPVQHDGFVELPAQLVASSGATEESPLMIEPSKWGDGASCCGLLCTTSPTHHHTHVPAFLIIVQDPQF